MSIDHLSPVVDVPHDWQETDNEFNEIIDQVNANTVAITALQFEVGQPLQAVAATNLSAGQAAYVSMIDSKLHLASAGALPSSYFAGLVLESTNSGFVATLAAEKIELTDWTAATGSVHLLSGSRYFLDVAGGAITPIPPLEIVGNTCTLVGIAISPTVMEVVRASPILF